MNGRRFDGRTAVITGASRGIGALTAAALIREGARVVSLSRTPPSAGSGVDHVQCDVTQPASVAAAADETVKRLGAPPDILINNAGIFRVATLDELKVATFTEVVNTNLLGPFLALNAFLGAMRRRGSGHVVTIGSVADRAAFKQNGAYSAAKYGLRGMIEVLRTELRGSGVRATLISPSSVDTAAWNSVSGGSGDPPGPYPARSDMLRGEDVVAAIVFALTQPERVNVDELRLSHS
jgi:NAD(P)-dependent dehydrogenase (short-subunit alcohol dehydrogenase family)